MNIYRNTNENWLLELLKNNYIKADKFISFSLDKDSGGQDIFGETKITFDRDVLDKQNLEDVWYEIDYFEQNPEICLYITGYKNEQDYYNNHEFDNAEEAHEIHEHDWESSIEDFGHEQELLIKELTYEDGMVLNVLFQKEPNKELKMLLNKNSIQYTVEGFKSFENFNSIKTLHDRLKVMGCTLDNDGYYSCDKLINLNVDFVDNGKLKIKFKKVGSFNCSNLNLTTLEGCPESVDIFFECSYNNLTSLEGGPKEVGGYFWCENNLLPSLKGSPETVGGTFDCSNNKLLSLEGGPKSVGGSFDCSVNLLTSLEGSPKRVKYIGITDLPELKTLHGGPEKINTSPNFHSIKSKYLSITEHEYWLRLLVGGVLNNETYFKDIFGLMISENNIEEIHKIQWPQEIIDNMSKEIHNLYKSKSGAGKFNLFEHRNILKFKDFTNEGLDKYYGKLDLSENIKTDTTELLSSVDLKEVDLHETLNLLVNDVNLEGMDIEQLADNTHFINALEKLSLKKDEPQVSKDLDTFLTTSLTFMGIYPIQVLEIQDPEYLMIQIGSGPIKLYKLSGSIKDFYDKLTSKTVEITSGDKNWIYKTSNSGNNWELQNQEEGNVFKKVMSTQELEDSLNSNTKITVIS